MFNWLKKRRAFTLGRKAAGSQEPDAKAVAMFIVYSLLIHKTSFFGVPVERVAGIKAGLPDEVRRTFETWGPFYIAWRLIERSGERYGYVFRADVTALVPACIEPVRDKIPDTGEIIGYFRKIFDMMDQTRREGELVEIGGYQMPIVARVAMNLIILEGDNSQTKANSAVELALALEELHGLAEPEFDHALALTAEKNKP